MVDIFVSYSRKDSQVAIRLVEGLRKVFGQERVWFDDQVEIGDEFWDKKIVPAIDRSKAIIFLVSDDAVRSDWCRKELLRAQALDKLIIPLIVRRLSTDYPGDICEELVGYLKGKKFFDLIAPNGLPSAKLPASVNEAIFRKVLEGYEREDHVIRHPISEIVDASEYIKRRTKIIDEAKSTLLIQIRVAATLGAEDINRVCRIIRNKAVQVRIVLCDPADDATMKYLCRREYDELDQEAEIAKDINDALEKFKRNAARDDNKGTCEVRLVQFLPSNVAYIAHNHEDDRDGSALVALTSFRTEEYWETPSNFIDKERHSELFRFYVQQFEELWNFGRPAW
ncbi:MAG: toll/interleukin-1 receptor domain-containing protein [Chloroflexota bacterium]